jgi:hypothetical protein
MLTLPLAFCRVGLGLWCGGSTGLPRPLAAPPQLHGKKHTATAPSSTSGRHARTGCHPSVALYCLYLSRIKMLIHQAAAIRQLRVHGPWQQRSVLIQLEVCAMGESLQCVVVNNCTCCPQYVGCLGHHIDD